MIRSKTKNIEEEDSAYGRDRLKLSPSKLTYFKTKSFKYDENMKENKEGICDILALLQLIFSLPTFFL